MPRSPLKPCAVRSCPGRATHGRHCAEHAHLNKKQRKKDDRPSAAKRGYDRNWRRIRARYLRAHKVCELAFCDEPATQVDHIIPLIEGGTHRFTNLQALCASHHSQKTVYLDGGFGNTRGGRE